MEKLDGTSFDIVADNIQKLKELFPEVVNGDNEIDFDNLRDIFEEYDENIVDDGEEHYKFTWWGKKEAKNNAKAKTTKTLRPVKKDSKNWDTTENIYIEGDNLKVLKILLDSYRNKIKMIYVDPPYNTGNDLIYVDKFEESDKTHLESTGQINEEGHLEENPKTDGKFHSKWLNKMFPRFLIARKLLTNDGVIFISIDDNEVHNLRKICDEIFGYSNFVTSLSWRRRKTQANLANNFAPVHDYILVYAKNKNLLNLNKEPYSEEFIKKTFKNPDNDPRGPYQTRPLAQPANSSNKEYELKLPNGRRIKAKWSCSQKTFDEYVKENLLYVPNNGEGMPRLKIFLSDAEGKTPNTWLDDIATNDEGSKEIEKLFGSNAYFTFPKPSNLIKYLLNIGTNEEDIILDFFSGSATTAHATIKLNSEDNGNRKFIMVQCPEPTKENSKPYKEGYLNICEIGKERIRRAGDKILEESENKDLDIGFKVFKVDETNFIPWMKHDITKDNVEQAILVTEKNIVAGRSELDLIYELLLKLNLDLNAPIDEVILDNELKNKIYVVRNGFRMICLDEELSDSIADDLLSLKEELRSTNTKVVLKDAALDDTNSINIYETLNSSNVEFYTI